MYGLWYLMNDSASKEENGEWGEQIVRNKIRKYFPKDIEHYLLNDLYIEVDGFVYQIDHLFIFSKGAFCIETKMISGKIYGDINDNNWTAISPSGGSKLSFASPIKQNNAHINALLKLFDYSYRFNSLIVFPRTNKPKKCPSYVVNGKELVDYLLNCSIDDSLTHDDMLRIKDTILEIQSNKKELKEKHKKQIKGK